MRSFWTNGAPVHWLKEQRSQLVRVEACLSDLLTEGDARSLSNAAISYRFFPLTRWVSRGKSGRRYCVAASHMHFEVKGLERHVTPKVLS